MNPLKVLIVDDSPLMCRLMQRILEAAGFAAVESTLARDGYEALAALRRGPVDLVITDVTMPRLDGEGLVACLARDDRLRSIPVLVVTADSTASRADRMLRMGARGLIVKPFLAEQLKAEVDRILQVAYAGNRV
jgi:two-component system chemotaxis response regulator CheY